jgi:hypothetical protein
MRILHEPIKKELISLERPLPHQRQKAPAQSELPTWRGGDEKKAVLVVESGERAIIASAWTCARVAIPHYYFCHHRHHPLYIHYPAAAILGQKFSAPLAQKQRAKCDGGGTGAGSQN